MTDISKLLEIMVQLRDPQHGCPWDVEQNFRTIAPFTIEEAYEVADAIERDDLEALEDELGDLLFQVVFHAQMASELGRFSFGDVVARVCDKMVRRHPHVFAEESVDSATAQTEAWERHKAAERAGKSARAGVLDDVPATRPALARAVKLGKRAARVGFDWPDREGVLEKIREELAELETELAEATAPERVAEEMGDLLFALANLARHLGLDPETALRGTNLKFESRFRYLERRLADSGLRPEQATLERMEALWQEAKGAGDSD